MKLINVIAIIILMAFYADAQEEFPKDVVLTTANKNNDICPMSNTVRVIMWDEKRHFCGSFLADAVKEICRSNYNPQQDNHISTPSDYIISKRHAIQKRHIADECCKVCCTPNYIKNNYCEYVWEEDTRPFIYVQAEEEMNYYNGKAAVTPKTPSATITNFYYGVHMPNKSDETSYPPTAKTTTTDMPSKMYVKEQKPPRYVNFLDCLSNKSNIKLFGNLSPLSRCRF